MTDRYLLFGYGSIGQRHAHNLMTLLPNASIVVIDPLHYKSVSLDEALEYPDIRGAIIASPTDQHLSQLLALQALRIPTYVEKPVCTLEQWKQPANSRLLEHIAYQPWKCAVGFQYRYHPVTERMHKSDRLTFTAQDDLIKKYGASVAETMASHSLDLAIFLQGIPRYAELSTDGVTFTGTVYHKSGAISNYNLRIDRGPRQSKVDILYERGGQVNLSIERDDQMYVHALTEWLHWTRDRVPSVRLAKLSDGLRVMKLIGEATP